MLCRSATKSRDIQTTFYHVNDIDTIADVEANAALSASELMESSARPMSFALTPGTCADASMLVLRNNHAERAEDFWTYAIKKTYQRALSESWTRADIQAAVMQSSLLSCSFVCVCASHETAADDYFRYPEDYAHNTPWNDWTPPSESARLFQAAAATSYVDPVSRRIRVHVVASADITAHAMIAFSTVEMNVEGKEALVVRRGAETLASLVLRSICLTSDPVNMMVIELKVATSRHGIYLRFEDVKRLEAFMVRCGWWLDMVKIDKLCQDMKI